MILIYMQTIFDEDSESYGDKSDKVVLEKKRGI